MIGRKIDYELATGDVILITPEKRADLDRRCRIIQPVRRAVML